MKTRFAASPSLPSLGVTLLLAGLFAVPLALWGSRWPWLVALPIAIMVILTARSEWLRFRAFGSQENIQIAATFIIESEPISSVSYPWQGAWIPTAPSNSWEISNVLTMSDYNNASPPVVDEKLTAVA